MDKSKLPVPLEKEEAVTFMQYLQARGLKYTHIRNEAGFSDKRGEIRNFRAVLDYQLGVSPGVPDFIVVLPGIGLLFIELKRQRGGTVSLNQKAWIEALNTVPGVQAEACEGAEAAIGFVERFYPL